ncbi:MAG: hypothetical protein IJ130_01525 [Solobacterium sp.]|nr:hypothetical protein [Erysipelotrichaceae bacterium]MBQ9152475.1 hypothetical protein [Solobacterium sp.]
MLTREEVLAGTKKIIMDNVPEMVQGELTEDTVLNNETAIDSMGFILVVTKLEGKFNVHIPDEEWGKMQTVRDLVNTVMKHLPKDNA